MNMPSVFTENIKVVSFDVGFTLIYTEPPVGNVYTEIASRFGYSLEPAIVHQRFMEIWKQKNGQNRAKTTGNPQSNEKEAFNWWKEIFTYSTGETISPQDRNVMFKVCYDEYANGQYWRIYPEVPDTLVQLRERQFKLVVLSNWDRRLHQTLHELRLDQYFDKIYISTEIGHAKPDPGAFRHICRDLNISPQALMHIGDSPGEDVAGALSAGVSAILLDREGRSHYKENASQFSVIPDLSKLIYFI